MWYDDDDDKKWYLRLGKKPKIKIQTTKKKKSKIEYRTKNSHNVLYIGQLV